MKNLNWYIYGTDYVLRQKCKKLYKFPYSHKKMYSLEEANRLMAEKIRSGESFFAGRFGLFELAAMRAYEFHNKDKYEIVMRQIYECAGFFPNDLSLGERFLQEMKEAVAQVDLLACSGQLAENYFMDKYMQKSAGGVGSFDIMEPWRYEKQFESMDKQYILRKKKESFGYSCLTNQRQFYQENYPKVVMEKGSIDDLILMMIRGEK